MSTRVIDIFLLTVNHESLMLNTSRQKPAKKYPFMGFRPSDPVDKRLRAVVTKSQKPLSQVLIRLILFGLPMIEKELGL